MKDNDLVHHLRYHGWATRRALEAATDLSEDELVRDMRVSHGSVLGTLVHIYAADRIWFSRLQGQGRTTVLDPEERFTMDSLRAVWPALLDEYVRWAEPLDGDGWGRVVNYTTTTGQAYGTRVRHIILHLVNHGSIHRGQVTGMLRQLGRTPSPLDMIAFWRSDEGGSPELRAGSCRPEVREQR